MRTFITLIGMGVLGGYLAWRVFCCPTRPRTAEFIDLSKARAGRRGRAALDDYQRSIDRRQARPMRPVFLREKRR